MNKAQLIEALAERLEGNRKMAAEAVDGMVDIVIRQVHKGEKVTLTGFGVFEKRLRAPRTARNPRTGETVKVKKTTVPSFRPGTGFKEVIAGQRKLPRATAAAGKSVTRASSTVRAAATARAGTARPTARASASPATRSTTSRTTSGRTTGGRTTSGRATTGRPTASRSTIKPAAKTMSTAKSTAAKKTTTAKAGPVSKATPVTKATPAAKTSPAAKPKAAQRSTAKKKR